MVINAFSVSEFLSEYWQQKPCVIKGFIKDFQDPLDEHDLAGLAQEENVDSRIVSFHQHQWQAAQGPFDEFESHCQGNWSLLVQGVDRYIQEVSDLADNLQFLPYWRMDDVMVSFSQPNAGVGPHIDEYDVFIVQGKGSRRWQVGLPCHAKEIIPHPLLKQIDKFEAIIDEVLMAGDAVYIPPKHPHNGKALSPCLNYSIGFRAPTNMELISGVLDESEQLKEFDKRYTDTAISQYRSNHEPPSEVSNKELERLRGAMQELLSSPRAEHALLQYLSRQELPDFAPFPQIKAEQISALFEPEIGNSSYLTKLPGVRVIYGPQIANNKNHNFYSEHDFFQFYIDGNMFEVSNHLKEKLVSLFSSPQLPVLKLKMTQNKEHLQMVNTITQLVNKGFWELEMLEE